MKKFKFPDAIVDLHIDIRNDYRAIEEMQRKAYKKTLQFANWIRKQGYGSLVGSLEKDSYIGNVIFTGEKSLADLEHVLQSTIPDMRNAYTWCDKLNDYELRDKIKTEYNKTCGLPRDVVKLENGFVYNNIYYRTENDIRAKLDIPLPIEDYANYLSKTEEDYDC